jgi:hypothetical protein
MKVYRTATNTQSDYTRSCINTIVLLRTSTELLETRTDSNKHTIEEIMRQVGYLPELDEGIPDGH